MRSHALTWTPDPEPRPARLPSCLPQDGSGFMSSTSIRRLSPQRTSFIKTGPSGNEGLNLFIEGGRINGKMYRGTSEVPQTARQFFIRLDRVRASAWSQMRRSHWPQVPMQGP